MVIRINIKTNIIGIVINWLRNILVENVSNNQNVLFNFPLANNNLPRNIHKTKRIIPSSEAKWFISIYLHYFKLQYILELGELKKEVLNSVFNISYHSTNYFSSSYSPVFYT